MSAAFALESVRLAAGGFLIVGGLCLMVAGAIGVLRFPDFYTRLHALNAGDALGGAAIALGLGCVSAEIAVSLRLLALAALLIAAAPTLAHMAANAAHAAGLGPIAGAYKAPRPGARKEGA